ncbi:MAG: LURP-one-related family protein [Lachnospiraceae bacterium]|nr:LURP-one-related family protein [Lachnospiraceae bacterium]
MAKLYMKQKIFSWKDRFTIKDQNDSDRYTVEGELISIGKKLHVYDMNNNEVAFVQQKVLTLLPRFFVFVNGTQVAEIVKEFTILRPKYRIEGLNWEVKGDLFDHDYQIIENGREIVRIHKVWFSWGDSYELDIADGANEEMVLAVVLAIDCVLDDSDTSTAAATN